jgi:predicted metal-binding membrane protein
MSGGMPMPGGWTMSMAWMRMPGQGWAAAACTFLGMWLLMMVAMMLPSLLPMLARYRRAARAAGAERLGRLTAIAGSGSFFVWTLLGVAAYAAGLGIAGALMRWPALSRAAPFATGLLLLAAGCVQLSTWKARQLSLCCEGPAATDGGVPGLRAAWVHGLRLGARCARCCSALMVVLLATGVMDLGPMAVVAGAITAERVLPHPTRWARAAGLAIVAAGLVTASLALKNGGRP